MNGMSQVRSVLHVTALGLAIICSFRPAAQADELSVGKAVREPTPTSPSPEPHAPASTNQGDPATATEEGAVQERGVFRDFRKQSVPFTPSPGVPPPPVAIPPRSMVTPNVQVKPPALAVPEGRLGTAIPFGQPYQAPTANLTLIANALKLKRKSLTTLVTVDPNVPVTQPVEISIGYYSPSGNNRITQSYVRSSGNRFLYNDKEGDGKPRTMTISISLREPKSGGGDEVFAVDWQAFLDPLYDVSIGPFAFDLISKCDAVGKNEIRFLWRSPDWGYWEQGFSMRAGSRTTISKFAWARSEVSWSHPLFLPQAKFLDVDSAVTDFLGCVPSGGCGFSIPGEPTKIPLLTGTTTLVRGNLIALNDSCQAYYEYRMTKTLRWYIEP